MQLKTTISWNTCINERKQANKICRQKKKKWLSNKISQTDLKTYTQFTLAQKFDLCWILQDLTTVSVMECVCISRNYLQLSPFFFHSPLPNPNALLSTLFSNTHSLCPSLDVTDQVPHPTLKQPNFKLSFSLFFNHWSEYHNSYPVTYIHIMHPTWSDALQWDSDIYEWPHIHSSGCTDWSTARTGIWHLHHTKPSFLHHLH